MEKPFNLINTSMKNNELCQEAILEVFFVRKRNKIRIYLYTIQVHFMEAR